MVYRIVSNGKTFVIEADEAIRVGGVLQLSRDNKVVGWFTVWESCVNNEELKNVDE
jgi:hypothetical protein